MKTVIIEKAFSAYENGKKVNYRKGDELTIDDDQATAWKGNGLVSVKVKPKSSFLSTIHTSDET